MKSRIRVILIAAASVAIVVATAVFFQRTQSSASSLKAGERLFYERNYSRALAALSTAHARNPEEERAAWYLYLTYLRLDRQKEADALLADLNPNGIRDSGILAELGNYHYEKKAYAQAARCYAGSLSLAENPAVRRRYAETLVWQKSYSRALAELDRLLRSNPSDWRLQELRADVLSWDGQYVKALGRYRELCLAGYHREAILKKMAPLLGYAAADSAGKGFGRELLSEKSGVTDPAERPSAGSPVHHAEGSEVIPSRMSSVPDADRGRGLAGKASVSGMYLHTEESAVRLLKRHPDDEGLLRRAISAHEAAGHPEQALALYERLLTKRPHDPALATAAARTFAWAGRLDRARQLYGAVIRGGKATDSARAEYAEVLYRDRAYGDAADQYRELWKKGALKSKQALDYSRALISLREYAAASGVLEELQRREPENSGVIEARADLAFALREYDRAERLYGTLIQARPQDPVLYGRLADIAMARHDYPKALGISRDMLRKFPSSENALLNIARISSWQRDYSTSLEYYDRLLGSVHASSRHYREKARVLGWMRAYGRSLRLYREAVSRYPEDSALRAESEAKKHYYRNAYRSSVRAYRSWLLAEPHHPEALFDLGQLYMQQQRWREAAQTYDALLADMPDHRQAATVRKKIDVLSSLRRLESGAEYFSAKSASRLTDVNWTGLRTALYMPIRDRVSVFVKFDRKDYRFESGRHTPFSNALTAGVEYRNRPDIMLRAAYGFKQNSGDLRDSHTGSIEAESMPLDNLHFDLAFRREEVIENYETFSNHLQKSRWQGRVLYDGFRRWNAGADYAFDRYSDGNSRTNIGADVTAHLFYEPTRLSVSYRWQNYGFSDRSGVYFSPESFTTHTFGLEWQHFLNDEELYRGTNDTYYSAAYRVSLEPGSSLSHHVEAGVYRDWNSRLSTSLQYQHTWNSKEAVYEDDRLSAQAQWHF